MEFMDCPTCGKRMITTAPVCRHCGQSPGDAAQLNRRSARRSAPPPQGPVLSESLDDYESQAHMSLEAGGYEHDEDDFDYEEFLEREQLRRGVVPRLRIKAWVWITAWVLIVLTLVPFLITFF